jgi:hypothetical protein
LDEQVGELLARAPVSHIVLSNRRETARLLKVLKDSGWQQMALALEHWALDAGVLKALPDWLRPHGCEPGGSLSEPWGWDDLDL